MEERRAKRKRLAIRGTTQEGKSKQRWVALRHHAMKSYGGPSGRSVAATANRRQVPSAHLGGHGAVHDGHVHAGLLPHVAVGKHAGDAAAARRAHPRVLERGE